MRTETTDPDGTIIVETTYDGGFKEISVYRPGGTHGKLLKAVVSRQIKGGKWCVYGSDTHGCSRFRVKRSALAQARTLANREA